MCVIFRIYSDSIIKHEQKYDQFTETNSWLLENNTKVLGNDEADVNNQMSRKYTEENIRSYLRFSSLVVLMLTLRAIFSLLMYKEGLQETKPSLVVVFVCDSSVS